MNIERRAGTVLSRRGFLSAALQGFAAAAVTASAAAKLVADHAERAADRSEGVKESAWRYVASQSEAMSSVPVVWAAYMHGLVRAAVTK